MDAHLVSPWNNEASQTNASTIQTKGRLPESSQLAPDRHIARMAYRERGSLQLDNQTDLRS